MRLMLLRHAKAEKAEPGMQDHARTLNPRGHNDAAKLGAYLARHALVPDRVLVSTAQRTRETWEDVAAELTSTPKVKFDERLYNSNAEGILALIKETEGRRSDTAGHRP